MASMNLTGWLLSCVQVHLKQEDLVYENVYIL